MSQPKSRFTHVEVPFDLDGDVEQITRKSGRVYVTPKGDKYPSITTVLGAGDKSWLYDWRARVGEEEANRVSHHASVRGSKVHDLMEKYVAGEEIDERKLMPLHKASFKKLAPIMDEHLSEWYVQEKKMWSDHLGVAGMMDLAGRWDNVRSVVDYKTSRRVKEKEEISNYFIQECAYSIMFEERTGIPLPNLVIVMDIDSNEPRVFKEHRDNWVQPLLDAISHYHREMRCRPPS